MTAGETTRAGLRRDFGTSFKRIRSVSGFGWHFGFSLHNQIPVVEGTGSNKILDFDNLERDRERERKRKWPP